jgi:hypothetical protein
MNDLLADPFFQSGVAPLVLGAALTGLTRAGLGSRAAAGGVLLTFLAVYLWVIGVPALPPPAAMGKLFWAGVAVLILAAILDIGRPPAAVRGAALLTVLVAALYWIIGAAVSTPAEGVAALVAAVAVGLSVFPSSRVSENDPVAAAAPTFAWAAAVGGVALIGGSASIAQLGIALTAATGGFLLWNWPKPRYAWGASGRGAQGLAVLLGAVLALFSSAPAVALAPALLAPAALRLAARLPLPNNALGRALRPAASFTFAVIPALASIGVALALTGGEASPY